MWLLVVKTCIVQLVTVQDTYAQQHEGSSLTCCCSIAEGSYWRCCCCWSLIGPVPCCMDCCLFHPGPPLYIWHVPKSACPLKLWSLFLHVSKGDIEMTEGLLVIHALNIMSCLIDIQPWELDSIKLGRQYPVQVGKQRTSRPPALSGGHEWTHAPDTFTTSLTSYFPSDSTCGHRKVKIQILKDFLDWSFVSKGSCTSRRGLNGACSVHEYTGSFQGQAVRFKMTSVCGHVMSLDFIGRYYWGKF